MVLPPGPVYPPTSPSMLTVGRLANRSRASRYGTSRTQRCTLSIFLSCASLRRRAAMSISFSSSGERGRTFSKYPSMAGSTPSVDTSVARACTRWNEGLSTDARSEEWMSCPGPRPHFSPLAISSSSITPLAPCRSRMRMRRRTVLHDRLCQA